MQRALLLGGSAVCVFVVVAAIMIKVMPAPLKSSDYMVIGSVATLVALLVMFLVVASTTLKSRDVFFKRRRK
jgi:DMSO/TMAO reductase YedYZ heme-binding membrane subunit